MQPPASFSARSPATDLSAIGQRLATGWYPRLAAAASQPGRSAARVGFVREGVRRAWDLDREGRPIDVIFYVLVRDLATGGQVGTALDRADR